MNSPQSDFSPESAQTLPPARSNRVPRLHSLAHRLRHAKDADGQLLADQLLFLLEIPPEGTRDRWQKGADLCESHGIKTSRMAVWRFYHAHILEWRRAQAPPLPIQPPKPGETAALHQMARHLAAERALDFLRSPALDPGHLVGLIQNDNYRLKIQLARDMFDDRVNDRIAARRELAMKKGYKALADEIRDKKLHEYRLASIRKGFAHLLHSASHTIS